MRIATASRILSDLSRSLVMASTFASLGIYLLMVGIPISVGMIASIPYVRVNSDSPVGLRLVVLSARNTPDSYSTHFPLVECMPFF